jgi:hypothetical protein
MIIALDTKAQAEAIVASLPFFSGILAEVKAEKCVGIEGGWHVVCVSVMPGHRTVGRTFCNSMAEVAAFHAAHGRPVPVRNIPTN